MKHINIDPDPEKTGVSGEDGAAWRVNSCERRRRVRVHVTSCGKQYSQLPIGRCTRPQQHTPLNGAGPGGGGGRGTPAVPWSKSVEGVEMNSLYRPPVPCFGAPLRERTNRNGNARALLCVVCGGRCVCKRPFCILLFILLLGN